MSGHLVKRSADSWSIKLRLGKDPSTGKKRQKWITVKGTKKQAEAELARRVHELDTGAFVARIGHAGEGFTLNTYVHRMPGQDVEAACRVDAGLRKAIEENRGQPVM